MPALIALLFALVLGAFFVSRRVGVVMLAAASVAVAGMFAWTWYAGGRPEIRRDAIPVAQVEIVDTRLRGNTSDYLIRNHDERWTLTALFTERVARQDDGTVLDRKSFRHLVEVPPGEERWETLRFFGLEIGKDYELEITGTEGAYYPGR